MIILSTPTQDKVVPKATDSSSEFPKSASLVCLMDEDVSTSYPVNCFTELSLLLLFFLHNIVYKLFS